MTEINIQQKKPDYKKRALAVVAGPWRLMQVLWLTFVCDDYDWDVIIKRYGEDLTLMDDTEELCKKSNRFSNIYNISSADPSMHASFSLLAKEYLQMLFYFCIGEKRVYCRELIERYVDSFDYDLLCVACSYSILEGAVLNFSDETETYVIEEGAGDYINVNLKTSFLQKIAGKVLYKMGYTNINCRRDFSLYRNCVKWASNPEALIYDKWKEKRKLFDLELTDMDLFLQKTVSLFGVEDEEYDLVFFTAPLAEFGKDDGIPELHEWLKKNYPNKKILIKRHPRDTESYEWNDLDLVVKYTNVPGEIILKCFPKADILFAYISTVFLSVDQENSNYRFIRFTKNVDDFYKANLNKSLDNWNISEEYILTL